MICFFVLSTDSSKTYFTLPITERERGTFENKNRVCQCSFDWGNPLQRHRNSLAGIYPLDHDSSWRALLPSALCDQPKNETTESAFTVPFGDRYYNNGGVCRRCGGKSDFSA